MELHFSDQEIKILKDICDIQIISFSNILRGNLLAEDEELLLQYQASLDIAKREAKWKISQYTELSKQPMYLGIMVEKDISIMRHILFHMEEVYIVKYPQGVKDLWNKFFLIEETRNPEIKLLTTNIKHDEKSKKAKSISNNRKVLYVS